MIRDFFAQKMTAVNHVLQELKFKLTDGHLHNALQTAIFPALASTIMPLVYQQNAEVDALILRTAAVIKGNPLPALDFLKVGPKLLQLLLQVLDDGRLTDGQGRTVDFRNTVIIMTSNLGSQYILDVAGVDEEVERRVREVLRQH